jgi:GT2 family glycosyltransferase
MKITLTTSVVIPTYRREAVLLDTIDSLLKMMDNADGCLELFIVDQTERHDPATDRRLGAWDQSGKIRWIRLDRPHITRSMNIGVQKAKGDIVLFLDDDIMPHPELINEHINAYGRHPDAWAVVGQVLQPWDKPQPVFYTPRGGRLTRYLDFPFFSTDGMFVENVMAGNLSVRRGKFISLGGFDENFTPPIATRFETEFAKRLVARGGNIWFEPKASIRHLRASTGGTRSQGNHLTSISPIHGIGDYYYALKSAKGIERLRYILSRPFREVRTKFHLKHPWYIPIKLLGEFRALFGALMIYSDPSNYFAEKRSSDGSSK